MNLRLVDEQDGLLGGHKEVGRDHWIERHVVPTDIKQPCN